MTPLPLANAPLVVLKFGGTSVSSRARWETIAAQVRERRAAGERVMVVCSAISGVSNLLEALPDQAIAGAHAAGLAAVVERHRALAADLGVELPVAELADVGRFLEGVALLGEVTPRNRARILAAGELAVTRMGAEFLTADGVDARWVDARSLLVASPEGNEVRRYLSATCAVPGRGRDGSHSSIVALDGLSPVCVTQGFIARDAAGDTVVLGRGGSDTSAAYLAALGGAVRLEIWTDVPGMYSADPRLVPDARLLRRLHYDEAQELAAMGAKVLHPRCLSPLRAAGIPLHIRSTPHPEAEGTVIRGDVATSPGVKAIAARRGILLVEMETVGMWQEVGFLAESFAVFRRHGLSIDLVATSQSDVTVSLDAAANVLEPARLDALISELRQYASVRVIGPCAAVSLVGRQIRATLHELAPAFSAFEEHRIHLVSQAASDLNLTVVVDEDQAERLVRELHRLVLTDVGADPTFGPRFAPPPRPPVRWWERADLCGHPTPAYVYHLPTIRERAKELLQLKTVAKRWYAVKANPHVDVLRTLHSVGIGFECVSSGEVTHVQACVPGAPILFTPNFAPRAEYEQAFAAGAVVTVDCLHPLQHWPGVFAGRDILLRVDPGGGRGHHRHVKTAGPGSKFGIVPGDLALAALLVQRAGARVIGLHAHVGSGILDASNWRDVGGALAAALVTVLPLFPEAHILDVGGGLGVPYRPGEPRLLLADLDAALGEVRRAWEAVNDEQGARRPLELWIEPGRWLVAEAGVLLTRVTQIKRKGDHVWIGVNAGMNALLRPALYGSWHEIVNLTRLDEPLAWTADIVGPICETGDVVGAGRAFPETLEGDVILIANAGAYGYSMASRYNLRELPVELVAGG